jgi:uncharacterized protein (DUF2141 family)
MNTNLCLKVLLVALFASGVSASAQTLTVDIENIKQIEGSLLIGVYNNESDFISNKYVQGKLVKVTGKTMSVSFPDLPAGTYAVSLFHDVNDNLKLDKNLFGLPSEPYGISSNPTGISTYQKCTFVFDQNMTIKIKLR